MRLTKCGALSPPSSFSLLFSVDLSAVVHSPLGRAALSVSLHTHTRGSLSVKVLEEDRAVIILDADFLAGPLLLVLHILLRC